MSLKRQAYMAVCDLVRADAVYTLEYLLDQAERVKIRCDQAEPKRCVGCAMRHSCRVFVQAFEPRIIE